VTHVLLAVFALARRADTVDVIGAALAAAVNPVDRRAVRVGREDEAFADGAGDVLEAVLSDRRR
jgi:hypothetical protein